MSTFREEMALVLGRAIFECDQAKMANGDRRQVGPCEWDDALDVVKDSYVDRGKAAFDALQAAMQKRRQR